MHVDVGEFDVLGFRVACQFCPFAGQIGPLGIGLGMHGNVLTSGHGHGAGHQPRHTGDQQSGVAGVGGRDADQQAGGRDNPVIGAQDGGAQPADTIASMCLGVPVHEFHCLRGLPVIRRFTSDGFRAGRQSAVSGLQFAPATGRRQWIFL
ncbi:hypothetical protein D3C86_1364720 [compost metagenome]